MNSLHHSTTLSDLLQKDRQYVWHPFTQMKDYENQNHVLIDRAEGIFLYDQLNNRYYDTVSSWWVNIHGHNHPRIKKAILNQLEKMDHVMFSGFTHEPAILLSEQLIQLAPNGLQKVFFSDNGSTAVEVALKMSFQYWQQKGKKNKTKFVYLRNSYHGDTVGAVSVGGVELFHALYKPLLFQAFQVQAPTMEMTESVVYCPTSDDVQSDTAACLDEAEALFKKHADEIAGFIVEPIIQAAGGMCMYPPSYLTGIRQLCDHYGIHLIADEVAVGFGRTGTMFGSEHASISPDLMCLSKGLTAGIMPMSVTLCTDEIYHAFYDDYETLKTFFHGHSFTGNPLACAVALESLKMFKDQHILCHVRDMESHLKSKLTSLSSLQHIQHVRHIGLVAAFQVIKDKINDTPFEFNERIGFQIYKAGLEEGLILRPLGDVIYYWLPLCITKEQIDDIILRTIKVLERLHLT